MNAVNFSDAQLDAMARRHMVDHRVGYFDALMAVGGGVQFGEASGVVAAEQANHSSDADKALHAKAVGHMKAHGVSFSEALAAVAGSGGAFSEREALRPAIQAVQQAVTADMTDSQMHFAAMAHHLTHKVSYAEALKVVADMRAEVRAKGDQTDQTDQGARGENDGDADKALHRAATSYAQANAVSYAEALDTVSAMVGDRQSEASAEQVLQAQPIEIFRSGTHVDTEGTSRVFTVDDVKGMASTYDRALHEAPLTIGHPVDDAPAQGWVNGLTATDDGVLMMQARKVDPVFAADVKAGRFAKRSASFYPPMAPNNPRPGHWYLRHVAWLGALPPAVKGLADVNFGAADNAVCFDF